MAHYGSQPTSGRSEHVDHDEATVFDLDALRVVPDSTRSNGAASSNCINVSGLSTFIDQESMMFADGISDILKQIDKIENRNGVHIDQLRQICCQHCTDLLANALQFDRDLVDAQEDTENKKVYVPLESATRRDILLKADYRTVAGHILNELYPDGAFDAATERIVKCCALAALLQAQDLYGKFQCKGAIDF